MGFSWKRWSLCVPFALLTGAALWLGSAPRGDGPSRGSSDGVPHTAEAKNAQILTSSAPPATAQRSPTLESSEVAGPHPDDPHEPGMLPHPLTPEHGRIFAENRTIQALNDAMALRNVEKMRELLAKYRTLDPKDVEATQAGYGIIADCIESPGDAALEAASRFYDTERHSPLRRFVRRICFENVD